MKLQIKRIYESAESTDGKRIFVDRLWARGISKEKAQLDEWLKEIAPSTELRQWYNHDSAKFTEFKQRYQAELELNPVANSLIEQLMNYNGTVNLLFSAKDVRHSNAVVLQEWLTEKLKKV